MAFPAAAPQSPRRVAGPEPALAPETMNHQRKKTAVRDRGIAAYAVLREQLEALHDWANGQLMARAYLASLAQAQPVRVASRASSAYAKGVNRMT